MWTRLPLRMVSETMPRPELQLQVVGVSWSNIWSQRGKSRSYCVVGYIQQLRYLLESETNAYCVSDVCRT